LDRCNTGIAGSNRIRCTDVMSAFFILCCPV